MSNRIEVKEGQQSSEAKAGTSSGEGQSSPTTNAIPLNLTTYDRIKKFFFSKTEWDAYLLEKLEDQNKRKDSQNADQNNYNLVEDPNDKRSVVAWIRTVFPSQEDANSFLKLQLEKLQEVKEVKEVKDVNEVKNVTESASQQSATVTVSTTTVSDSKTGDRK